MEQRTYVPLRVNTAVGVMRIARKHAGRTVRRAGLAEQMGNITQTR